MAKPKKIKKKDIEELKEFNTSVEKRDKSCFVPQGGKLKEPIKIRIRDDLTEKQKGLITLIKDKHTKVVFVDGPAGTAKSFTCVQAGLELLNEKRVSEFLFLRSIAESSQLKLGALPGLVSDKFGPFMSCLEQKLDELLDAGSIKKLKAEGFIKAEPINFQRGASHNAKYILLEEAQSLSEFEIKTIMTRLGKYSTLVIIGDHQQADIRNSGFQKIFNLFDDERSRTEGVYCLKFTKDDILRSGIVKYIVERFEEIQGE